MPSKSENVPMKPKVRVDPEAFRKKGRTNRSGDIMLSGAEVNHIRNNWQDYARDVSREKQREFQTSRRSISPRQIADLATDLMARDKELSLPDAMMKATEQLSGSFDRYIVDVYGAKMYEVLGVPILEDDQPKKR